MSDNHAVAWIVDEPRTIFGALVLVAFVSYFGLQAVGRPLAGVGAFVVLFGGALALWSASTTRLFDERDRRRHQHAAGRTVAVFGWLCAVGFPTMVALDALGHVTWPAWLSPVGAAVIVFYLTYVGVLFAGRVRP